MVLEGVDGFEGHGLILNERATAHDFSQLAARFDGDLDVVERDSCRSIFLLTLLVAVNKPVMLAVEHVVARRTGGEMDV